MVQRSAPRSTGLAVAPAHPASSRQGSDTQGIRTHRAYGPYALPVCFVCALPCASRPIAAPNQRPYLADSNLPHVTYVVITDMSGSVE